MQWSRKAADQGHALAQHNLGVMYDKGQGVPQDYAEAVRWYRKAADQRFAGAQSNLGDMYFHGQGVPQDYALAMQWSRKAADQGNIMAQYNLGVMYDLGQGVPQDYVHKRTCGSISPPRVSPPQKTKTAKRRSSCATRSPN
jgi:hypothetical protein